LNKPVPPVPPEWGTYLKTYRFPGNVRELKALITDAVSRYEKGILSLEAILPPGLRNDKPDPGMPEIVSTAGESGEGPGIRFSAVLPTLDEAQSLLMEEALRRTQGNQGAAARLLGISRRTLIRHLKRRSS